MTDKNEVLSKKRVRRDRKEEILKEAATLFGIHGFRGTSLSSVAEAVGLTEPGLLHYFPSKVKLLQGVLAYRDHQDEKKYAVLIQPDNVYLLDIFEALEGLVAENEKIPGLVRLYTVLVGESIRSDHPSHDYFVNRYEQIRNVFSNYFANFNESEKIPGVIDIEQLSTLLVAVMDGLQIQWLLDPENVSMTETFNLFLKIIQSYLEEHTT